MVKLQVPACDICGALDGNDNGAVREYRITFADGTWKADLCEVHAKPLAELRDQVPRAFVRSGQRRHASFRVVDEAEIEKAKKPTQRRGGARKST